MSLRATLIALAGLALVLISVAIWAVYEFAGTPLGEQATHAVLYGTSRDLWKAESDLRAVENHAANIGWPAGMLQEVAAARAMAASGRSLAREERFREAKEAMASATAAYERAFDRHRTSESLERCLEAANATLSRTSWYVNARSYVNEARDLVADAGRSGDRGRYEQAVSICASARLALDRAESVHNAASNRAAHAIETWNTLARDLPAPLFAKVAVQVDRMR